MDRKYRHQGYQDSGGDDRDRRKPPPRRPLTPDEKAQLRGLRHATERDAQEVLRCPDCGRNIQQFGAVGFDKECPHCSAPLHTCRACRHFDTGARWECRAEIAERVPDKGKPNRCPGYEARIVLDATGKRQTSPGSQHSNDPKSAFESLFKK